MSSIFGKNGTHPSNRVKRLKSMTKITDSVLDYFLRDLTENTQFKCINMFEFLKLYKIKYKPYIFKKHITPLSKGLALGLI